MDHDDYLFFVILKNLWYFKEKAIIIKAAHIYVLIGLSFL